MRKLSLGDRVIGDDEPCFIIAEIGQNHQGDIHIARQLIDVAKDCGADCVKFQKCCVEEKFTKSALERPYDTPHSWGSTYGEHKRYLEFSDDMFQELQKYAKTRHILFAASAMDLVSLKYLISINVPFLKIGSGDSENLLLIEEAAKARIPLVISTGMTDIEGVHRINSTVQKYHQDYALLHCVSSYPTLPMDANLKVISTFQTEFQNTVVGYSGHEEGYTLSLAAAVLGAKIIERHITLDKSWKGTDHRSSLTPSELIAMTKSIRDMEAALGDGNKMVLSSELPCLRKLGKTIVASRRLKAPIVIAREDLKIKVAGERGFPPHVFAELVGRKLIKDLEEDDILREEYLDTGSE